MSYSILHFGSLPPKITFFCPHCVIGSGIKKSEYKPYKDINCRECGNYRLIAPHTRVEQITRNYCIPSKQSDYDYPGSSFILLLTNAEVQGGISEDLTTVDNLVNTARFLKDRFFFGVALDEEFFKQAQSHITEIAWIPR